MNTLYDTRANLLERLDTASTETEKASIIEALRATLSEREANVFSSENATATELISLRNNIASLDAKYKQAIRLAIALGFPTDTKVETVSANNTIKITTTKRVVDSEALEEAIKTDSTLAVLAQSAIEARKAKIGIATLTTTDFPKSVKNVPYKDVPTTPTPHYN